MASAQETQALIVGSEELDGIKGWQNRTISSVAWLRLNEQSSEFF